MLSVSAGATQTAWSIDQRGKIYAFHNNQWNPISTQPFRSAAVGETGIWGITEKGQLLYRQGISTQRPHGYTWLLVGEGIAKMDVGLSNLIFGIRTNGELVQRTGVTEKRPTGDEWIPAGKTVSDVSLGTHGIWVIDTKGKIWFGSIRIRRSDMRALIAWKSVEGNLKTITAGYGGSVWGILKDGRVVRREGISSQNPYGSSWYIEPGLIANDISAGISGVYITLPNGKVISYRGKLPCFNFLEEILILLNDHLG